MIPTALDIAALRVGASFGATTRHVISQHATKSQAFGALHIAKINIVGSLLLGTLAGVNKGATMLPPPAVVPSSVAKFSLIQSLPNPRLTLLLGVGFCGSLTTFSTFSLDMIKLLEAAEYTTCAMYFLLNNVGGAAAAGIGYFGAMKLLRRYGAAIASKKV